VLEEKRLVAPSLRVGQQWLDAVACAGAPILNARITTFINLALEISAVEMEQKGLTYMRPRRADMLAGYILEKLRKDKKNGYLVSPRPMPGLRRMLLRTIRDLRMADIQKKNLIPASFESRIKGQEIGAILAEYRQGLATCSLADDAAVFAMAAKRMQADPEVFPTGTFVLLSEDVIADFTLLEQAFWEAIPKKGRQVLPSDSDEGPFKEINIDVFCAVGEANEVREVFRRVKAEKIPFDEVEILHTDAATYVPIIFDFAAHLVKETGDTPPVTFAEGLPVGYSRPGRALSAWVSWIRNGYPQDVFASMLQDGLLKIPDRNQGTPDFARLAAMFRTLTIGAGQQRYSEVIGGKLAALKKRAKAASRKDGAKKNDPAMLQAQIKGFACMSELVHEMLLNAPTDNEDSQEILRCARHFLVTCVRTASRFDAYSLDKITQAIDEIAGCLVEDSKAAWVDVWGELAGFSDLLRVGGMGPCPGCLFVSNIRTGGHSARKHTFVLGMDDARFPGAGMQDPLFLDSERGRISKTLPTAVNRLAAKKRAFARLVGRLRGWMVLSYTCQDLVNDRERFPSSDLAPILGHKTMQALKTSGPVSFAPREITSCLNMTEWWLGKICGEKDLKDLEKITSVRFSNLAQGLIAHNERASDRFTEYDGHVPEAGKDFDPTLEHGPVLSSSRIQLFAYCPMEYFFKYILEISPPVEYAPESNVWLPPREKGTLLHRVLYEFMTRLHKKDQRVVFERDHEMLLGILDQHAAKMQKALPVPAQDVFEKEITELRQVAEVFLKEEESRASESYPAYFELAIGMAPEGEGGALDTQTPGIIRFADGKKIRARAKIDRVDIQPNASDVHYIIWDYKTGKGSELDAKDPFNKGRTIQGVLYAILAQQQLKKVVSSEANVTQFGYYMLHPEHYGERKIYPIDILRDGVEVIEHLCDMAAKGCFPCAPKAQDIRNRAYTPLFNDLAQTAKDAKRKMENSKNAALGLRIIEK